MGNIGQTWIINACTELPGDEFANNNCKAASISNIMPDYCLPCNKISSRYIYRVMCGSIDNTSDWQGCVADFTHLSTTIEDGASQDIYVKNVLGQPESKVWVWVDWDKNLVFDSPSELFILSSWGGSGSNFHGEIIVPVDIPPVEYRMRIRLTETDIPDPCVSTYFGETEDYTIVVVAQPVTDVGVHSIRSPFSNVYLGDEEVKIRVKNYGSDTQSNIPVFFTLDGGDPVTGIVEGPILSRQTLDYTFPGTINLGTIGQTYLIYACTVIDNDEVPENDCKTRSVTNYLPDYCDCSTSTEDEWIANVLFGDIDNSSGWQGGVAIYIDQFTSISPGDSAKITITNGNAWASDIVYVWVD